MVDEQIIPSSRSNKNLYKDQFDNWDMIIFALAYHDFIYDSLKSNNEEKSAEAAVKRLTKISFPEKLTASCQRLILATKKHEPGDLETNLFTDADLSILGSEPEIYNTYTQQIRREYSIYPDLIYNPGRKKVLMHFLEMGNIYKTKEFSEHYELKARANLRAEIDTLTK